MGKSSTPSTPALAPPGAGLPWLEAFVLRYIALPLMGALIPWDIAARRFQREGQRILAFAEGTDPNLLTTRILVPRLMAMEDSSRYWSVAMAVRHLMMVGEPLAEIIVTLSQDRVCPLRIGIADVKPAVDTPASVVREFRAFLTNFDQHLRVEVGNRDSRHTHVHPWMGPLTPRQWLCLAAVHQRLHRRQIQLILRCLGREQS